MVAEGVATFGRLDIVAVDAGILRLGEGTARREIFRGVIDVNLIGVWNSVEAAIPALVAGGRGGSIVITSSVECADAAASTSTPTAIVEKH